MVDARSGYGLASDVVRGAPSAEWKASRYCYLSTDDCKTWTVVRDSNPISIHMHSHGVLLDDGVPGLPHPRLFFTYHGHDNPGTTDDPWPDDTNMVAHLLASDDLGATWYLVNDVHPMAMALTANGPVFTTDGAGATIAWEIDGSGERDEPTTHPYQGLYVPDGVFHLDRETFEWTQLVAIPWTTSGASPTARSRGLTQIGRSGCEDRATGIAYFGFRSNTSVHPVPIVATDGKVGTTVWQRDPAVAEMNDRVESLGVTAQGKLIARLNNTSGPNEHLVATAARWSPGRTHFRRDDVGNGTRWVPVVATPDGPVDLT
jgi:hypothetical protein